MPLSRLLAENDTDLLFQEDGGGHLLTEDSSADPSSGGFETPDVSGRTVQGYQLSLGAGESSDLISCVGARDVRVAADVSGVQLMLPAVPASGNPTNSGGVQLAGLVATATSGPAQDPTGRAGGIPEHVMPPFFYLENTAGSTATVSVWVRF